MRRMGICEEKSIGIDGVMQAAGVFQLPAPDLRTAKGLIVQNHAEEAAVYRQSVSIAVID